MVEDKKKMEEGIPPGVPKERYDAQRVIRGRYKDEVFKLIDGKEVKVEETSWQSNRIVTNMSSLLAGLMKNDGSFNGGILQHAQGRGQSSFDVSLPAPPFNSVALVDEFFRKTPDSISYLDGTGQPTVTITGSILIKTTLGFLDANGPMNAGEFIREQGLYGGPATAAPGSGLLANLIFHKARFKDVSVKIIRFINLIF